MAKLTKKCPWCKEIASEQSHSIEGDDRVIHLTCGHTIIEKQIELSPIERLAESLTSQSGKRPYHYQLEGINFAESANLRVLIADDMGLGKTVQGACLIKLHPEIWPVLVACKRTLVAQWFYEIFDWTGKPAQILTSGRDRPLPSFDIYIVSLDLLRNLNWPEAIPIRGVIVDECQLIKNASAKRTQAIKALLSGKVKRDRVINNKLNERKRIEMIANDLMRYHNVNDRFELNFEKIKPRLGMCECYATKDGILKGRITIDIDHARYDNESDIIDTITHEIAHAITPGAGHRKIWSDTDRAIGGTGEAFAWCDGTETYKQAFEHPKALIALSGTPIKNNAREYFTILNMLRPEIFNDEDYFLKRYCEYVFTGRSYKIGGLNPSSEEDFRNITKDFVIRRLREDVLPDLPKIQRTNKFIEISDHARKEWNKSMEQFMSFIEDDLGGKVTAKNTMNILQYINAMRHLTGMAKVEAVVEYVIDFLESTDRYITIFHHHKDVGYNIALGLRDYCAKNDIQIIQLNPETPNRDEYVRNCAQHGWVSPDHRARVGILSTLANSEGLNLQKCDTMIQVERQWNPANEEQAEARFPRPGSVAQSIQAVYATALNTIDEWFGQLVEQKRQYMKNTLDGETYNWDESSIILELTNIIMSKGRRSTYNPTRELDKVVVVEK